MNVLLVFLIILCSCESKPNLTTISGNEMTIDYRVQIAQSLSNKDIFIIQDIIASSFHEVNEIHNKWNPNSEISRLNRLTAFEKAPISKELLEQLKLADQIHKLSQGKFDPTIEPLQQLWKKKQVPETWEIERIKPAIGWSKIHFDETGFWKEHALTKLDLCGIAKGHLVDLIVERLVAQGYEHVYVEWGGEIRVHGKHPQRPWTIFISQLGNKDPNNAIAKVSLIDEAIATSGDYEQFWEFSGKKYFHVMNPSTLSPVEIHEKSVASVSVTASTCALADGLATAALTFQNEEEAIAWLEEVKTKLNLVSINYWIKSN